MLVHIEDENEALKMFRTYHSEFQRTSLPSTILSLLENLSPESIAIVGILELASNAKQSNAKTTCSFSLPEKRRNPAMHQESMPTKSKNAAS